MLPRFGDVPNFSFRLATSGCSAITPLPASCSTAYSGNCSTSSLDTYLIRANASKLIHACGEAEMESIQPKLRYMAGNLPG